MTIEEFREKFLKALKITIQYGGMRKLADGQISVVYPPLGRIEIQNPEEEILLEIYSYSLPLVPASGNRRYLYEGKTIEEAIEKANNDLDKAIAWVEERVKEFGDSIDYSIVK